MTAREMLEQQASAEPDWAESVTGMVLAYGKEFPHRPRGETVPQMTPKACFNNCFDLAFERNWSYAEGFAVSDAPILFHHAWCVDGEGNAVDPTLDDPGCSYFGIQIANLGAMLDVVRETERPGLLYTKLGRTLIEELHG